MSSEPQTTDPRGPITQLLIRSREGDPEALNRLMPLVYGELHRLAQSYLRKERVGHTLQSTALVNEAYLRLVGGEAGPWQNRAHFLGVAANLMRQILVDHARARNAAKRGGNPYRLTLPEGFAPHSGSDVDLAALDDALNGLAELDAQQARIVELRFFAGLTIEESAAVLGVSTPTVKRHWASARAWLFREISEREGEAGEP